MEEFSSEDIEAIQKEITISVGLRIRSIRKNKGWTQVELANKIHSDRQYMYKIENAKVGISLAKLSVIAKALEVPLDFFFDDNFKPIINSNSPVYDKVKSYLKLAVRIKHSQKAINK